MSAEPFVDAIPEPPALPENGGMKSFLGSLSFLTGIACLPVCASGKKRFRGYGPRL